jgi:Domain of unknown function (DUF4190)
MSDTPLSPDWQFGSDGKWHPPSQTPGEPLPGQLPGQPPAGQQFPGQPAGGEPYPTQPGAPQPAAPAPGSGQQSWGIDPTYQAPPGFVPTSVAQPTLSEIHSVPPEQASGPLYGGPAYGLAPGQQLTRSILPGNNGYAIASLVLGIFGFLIITGFFSIVCGWVGIGQINKSEGLQRGRPLAILGIILTLAWWIIGVLWIVHKVAHHV